jgi:hypothetical protein
VDNALWQIVWLPCGVATIVAGVLASRSRRARYVGRAAVGVLFIVGGHSCTSSTSLLTVITPASRILRISRG